MTKNDILALIKTDLQISVNAYDEPASAQIDLAIAQIEREGITLSLDSVEDCMLVEQYAVWLARKRKEAVPMSPMLRYQLSNRLLSEKMGGE